MKFGKETKETYCQFDVDLSKKEWETLKEYGRKTIEKDDGALINYAINDIVRKEVERSEK